MLTDDQNMKVTNHQIMQCIEASKKLESFGFTATAVLGED